MKKYTKIELANGSYTKLKPCPFCGCDAKVNRVDRSSWFVCCSGCSCQMPGDQNTYYTSEESAIIIWNTRRS